MDPLRNSIKIDGRDLFNPGDNGYAIQVGFHLGFPLALLTADIKKVFKTISRTLRDMPSENGFSPAVIEFPEDVKVPLIPPLCLIDRQLYEDLRVQEFCSKHKLIASETCPAYIFIYPSGAVTFLFCLPIPDGIHTLSKSRIKEIFDFFELDESYTVFGNRFYFLLKILNNLFNENQEINVSFIHTLINNPSQELSARIIEIDRDTPPKYDRLVKDILHLQYIFNELTEKYEIQYVTCFVHSGNYDYLTYFILMHATFIEFQWMTEMLDNISYKYQERIINDSPFSAREVLYLKALKIFFLQFINQSRPISIGIYHKFYFAMQEYWKKGQIGALEIQINHHFDYLEKVVDWYEKKHYNNRQKKLTILGTIIASISFAAVIATLISTIDFDEKKVILPSLVRLIVIVASSLIIILFTFLSIYRKDIIRFLKKKSNSIPR